MSELAIRSGKMYEIIGRDRAEEWAGRKLSDEEMERLIKAIPFSSIPDAIDTIVASWE